MTAQQFFFILFSGFTLIAGLRVVTAGNLFHAALWLIATLAGVAGLFVLLEAGFLAAVQVLLYIGAISILIIFAVMLTRGVATSGDRRLNSWSGLGAVVAIVLMIVLAQVIGTFLALLELIKTRIVKAVQIEQFGAIRIIKAVTESQNRDTATGNLFG